MKEKGVLETLKVKKQAISSATEVAIMILRIDDVIAAKALEKEKEKSEETSTGEESESESEE